VKKKESSVVVAVGKDWQKGFWAVLLSKIWHEKVDLSQNLIYTVPLQVASTQACYCGGDDTVSNPPSTFYHETGHRTGLTVQGRVSMISFVCARVFTIRSFPLEFGKIF
jgi:hypothetical protein